MDRKRGREKEREREGERDDMRARFVFFFVSMKNQHEDRNVAYLRCQEAAGSPHVLICQVGKCFGSVGGEVLMCASCLCTRDGCVEQDALAQAPALPLPSCHIHLSFRHQWRRNFLFFLTV